MAVADSAPGSTIFAACLSNPGITSQFLARKSRRRKPCLRIIPISGISKTSLRVLNTQGLEEISSGFESPVPGIVDRKLHVGIVNQPVRADGKRCGTAGPWLQAHSLARPWSYRDGVSPESSKICPRCRLSTQGPDAAGS